MSSDGRFMDIGYQLVLGVFWGVEVILKYKDPCSNTQSSLVIQGSQESLFSLIMPVWALMTTGSMAEDLEIFWARSKSS